VPSVVVADDPLRDRHVLDRVALVYPFMFCC
jgi:hypothetical protein